MNIGVEDRIKELLPELKLGVLLTQVSINDSSPALLDLIDYETTALEGVLTPEYIRELDAVSATRQAYRVLGKDPSRYRPSAESLLRRIALNKGLYRINNVVDILNLTSLKTGYSICGYDYQTIKGEPTLGIGTENEVYEGIGRGVLNIENLPVFRDSLGVFGNPTSDSVRTMVTKETTHFLMIILGFNDAKQIERALDYSFELLKTHAQAIELERHLIDNK